VSPAWIAAAGLAGLLLGPLQRAAVFASSGPAGQPWRRSCPACGDCLTEGQRTLLAVAWLTGRCPRCGSRIGLRPLVPELVTAATLALLAGAASSVPELAALALLAAGAITLAFTDAAVHRLPNRITLPLAAAVTGLLAVTAATSGQWGGLLRAVLAAAALAGFYLVLLIVAPSGTGPGDVKFALPLGAMLGWYGWGVLFTGTVCTFLLAGVYALALLISHRAAAKDSFAFGPFMAAGALAAIVAASAAT
jgi:leader peptidase (prepilin peptidase)/N-methyltransferase